MDDDVKELRAKTEHSKSLLFTTDKAGKTKFRSVELKSIAAKQSKLVASPFQSKWPMKIAEQTFLTWKDALNGR